MSNMHDFTMDSIDGKPVNLADFKDQLCLVVNVASA
jgi:glutathione peroxidase-family protein